MKKTLRISALVLTLGILSAQSAYAAYSAYGTFSITNNPVVNTTNGTMLKQYKSTMSGDFSVVASAKTMSSTPSVRLVNSNLVVRSSYVGVPLVNAVATGSGNSGNVGDYLYAQVKPALNQINTDTITLKFDPK